MSSKGAKGKGKSRGGGVNSQRPSRSRNTTPASGSADTHHSSESSRISYEEFLDRYNISDTSSIPSSQTLLALKDDLSNLVEAAKARARHADQMLREITLKKEAKKAGDASSSLDADLQEKTRKAAAAAEGNKKKRKKSDDNNNKRPPAIGAHQATGQSLSTDAVAQRERKRIKTDNGETKPLISDTSSDELSDVEHQPPPAAPFVVFEPLDDDPAIYEIQDVTTETPYEEKARAFSVARFPESDLSDLIPGDPPDEDLSKQKPSNQVAISTFSTWCDPYFRPFTEEDLAFLRERGDRTTPYIMPKLGRHYSEVWAEEDGNASFASPAPPTNSNNNKSVNQPKGKPDDMSEDHLDKEDVSVGPLLARMLAAFIPEEPDPSDNVRFTPQVDSSMISQGSAPDSTPAPKNFSTSLPGATDLNWKVTTGKTDYALLDERIHQEMVYIGLLHPDETLSFDNSEDDEVAARLRALQAQLREQSLINGARKARIAELLKEHMAYQEYVTILDDLDKQVEQAYSKRSRNMKPSKKKKVPNGVGVAQARMGIGEQAKTLMERRKRWMESIGPVFDKDLMNLPGGSTFEDLGELVEAEKQLAVEEE